MAVQDTQGAGASAPDPQAPWAACQGRITSPAPARLLWGLPSAFSPQPHAAGPSLTLSTTRAASLLGEPLFVPSL